MRYTHRKDLQKKLDLKQKKIDAGLLSEKYPSVSSIVIRMKYFWTPEDTFLMLRTVRFDQYSWAYFHMQCAVKECEKGGFELTAVVGRLIRDRGKKGKGDLVCKGKGNNLTRRHARIEYEITVQYFRGSE